MSLASVGALIGIGGLGGLITEGFKRNNAVEMVVGDRADRAHRAAWSTRCCCSPAR